MPDPTPESVSRIDAILVQPVLVTYVSGLPIQEQVGEPRKIFLAANPDVRESVFRVFRGEALPVAPAVVPDVADAD